MQNFRLVTEYISQVELQGPQHRAPPCTMQRMCLIVQALPPCTPQLQCWGAMDGLSTCEISAGQTPPLGAPRPCNSNNIEVRGSGGGRQASRMLPPPLFSFNLRKFFRHQYSKTLGLVLKKHSHRTARNTNMLASSPRGQDNDIGG